MLHLCPSSSLCSPLLNCSHMWAVLVYVVGQNWGKIGKGMGVGRGGRRGGGAVAGTRRCARGARRGAGAGPNMIQGEDGPGSTKKAWEAIEGSYVYAWTLWQGAGRRRRLPASLSSKGVLYGSEGSDRQEQGREGRQMACPGPPSTKGPGSEKGTTGLGRKTSWAAGQRATVQL